MLKVLLSPSKTMDFKLQCTVKNNSIPVFIKESQELIDILRQLDKDELIKLMKISPSLASINYQRFKNWHFPFINGEALPAVFAFKGDVYEGLRADKFTLSDLEFAMKKIRIISGLYGLLRPLDLIMPYRLEMGTKLHNSKGKNLYKFWGDKITTEINKSVEETGANHIINLASAEYFKAINVKKLHKPLITPVFMEAKGGNYEVVGVHAKRARGLMASFIITNRIVNVEDLKEFKSEKYNYTSSMSTEYDWVFSR